MQVVAAHIHAAHRYAALAHVVQARNQLYQARFGRTRATQHAYRLPGGDAQVHVIQHRLFGLGIVAEGHVIKDDGAVSHRRHRVFGGYDGAFLLQHLVDALHGGAGDDDHDKHHAQHHQAGENLHGVGEQAGQLARGQAQRRVAAAGHHRLRAEPADEQHAAVDGKLHQRHVEGEDALGAGEVLIDIARDGAELFLLMGLAHKGLDHADAAQVFAHDAVEAVIEPEHALKNGMRVAGDQVQADAQDRDEGQEDHRQLPVDADGGAQGKYQHERRAHRDADHHLIGVLHVGYVRGHARDQAAGGKLVDIGKGIVLHMAVHVLAKVLGKPGRSHGRVLARQRAEAQRHQRRQNQDQPRFEDVGHVAAVDPAVDQVGHDQRDHHLHHHLQGYKNRCFDGYASVFPNAFHQAFYHCLPSLLKMIRKRRYSRF